MSKKQIVRCEVNGVGVVGFSCIISSEGDHPRRILRLIGIFSHVEMASVGVTSLAKSHRIL